MKATQILQASVLGTIAFKSGKKCVPAHDSELMKMLANRQIGQTPKGHATSIQIMKAWTTAWHNANITAN